MLGIIVQLAISWALLWFIARKDLSVLGFRPTTSRLLQFVFFLFISVVCCASGFLMKKYFGNQQWHVNPGMSMNLLWEGLLWNIRSVLFEELIFRGAILYLLMWKLGNRKAIFISAVAFGVYHWFSYGILGQVVPMIVFFIITGLMGLLLAYAYSKTLSLYIPIAIHLGWNFTQGFLFSDGPIGNGILVRDDPTGFRTNSLIVYILVTALPLLALFVTDFLLIKKLRPKNTPQPSQPIIAGQ
jgi:uncharacterized protein